MIETWTEEYTALYIFTADCELAGTLGPACITDRGIALPGTNRVGRGQVSRHNAVLRTRVPRTSHP